MSGRSFNMLFNMPNLVLACIVSSYSRGESEAFRGEQQHFWGEAKAFLGAS